MWEERKMLYRKGKILIQMFTFAMILSFPFTGCKREVGEVNKERNNETFIEKGMPSFKEFKEMDFDEKGDVIFLDNSIEEGEKLEQILWNILAYAGECEGIQQDEEQFWKGIQYIQNHLDKEEENAIVQTMKVHALLKAYRLTGESKWLESCLAMGDRLITMASDLESKDIGRDLTAQIYAGAMLGELWKETKIDKYFNGMSKEKQEFIQNFEKYDSGQGIRKGRLLAKDITLRFVNPYELGFNELSIFSLLLRDPITREEISIDEAQLLENNKRSEDRWFIREGTEVTFPIPVSWQESDRTEWYELEITYMDEKQGNVALEIQSSVRPDGWRALRDSDILMTGSGERRSWMIPIRPSEIGEEIDQKELEFVISLCNKVRELEKDGEEGELLLKMSQQMKSYSNILSVEDESTVVWQEPIKYPTQTFQICWQIKDGILVQRLAGENTIMVDGVWDGTSPLGELGYNPYLVATQAKGPIVLEDNFLMQYGILEETYDGLLWVTEHNIKDLSQEDALEWLDQNKVLIGRGQLDAYVWETNSENAYSDIVQKAPWTSAFFQRHIIEAYLENGKLDSLDKMANAFCYMTDEGGLSSKYWMNGKLWFEEVPNNTHILNAHLACLVALDKIKTAIGYEKAEELYEIGVSNLIDRIASYDTGYWSVYDRNPQKELLFQIDCLEGDSEILVEHIKLINTGTNTCTEINVGEENDFSDYPMLSGTDWGEAIMEDGRMGRPVKNGYTIREEALDGGVRQNSFFYGVLPEREFEEYFDVPVHKLIIRYKDIGKGKYMIKLRSKNQGDVLEFEPLRNAVIECNGDGTWKQKEILLTSGDLGFYMGYEYHSYHAKEIENIANISGNLYLKQYAEKWNYYFKLWEEGKKVIIVEPAFKEAENEEYAEWSAA
ncbi:hypothetical protein D7X25_13850 [bacterium 1XD42-8]|nr:hypothetical protein D7X25_13850 [bacterium 1XD42-8]